MAYLAPIETDGSEPIALPAPDVRSQQKPAFSDLEWSIIRFARLDRLWTIRPLGPLRRFWNSLAGRGNPQLANPRLEALRRMAVLSWHYGFTVPGDDVAEFLSAGFTADQYELLVRNVRTAATAAAHHNPTEVLA